MTGARRTVSEIIETICSRGTFGRRGLAASLVLFLEISAQPGSTRWRRSDDEAERGARLVLPRGRTGPVPTVGDLADPPFAAPLRGNGRVPTSGSARGPFSSTDTTTGPARRPIELWTARTVVPRSIGDVLAAPVARFGTTKGQALLFHLWDRAHNLAAPGRDTPRGSSSMLADRKGKEESGLAQTSRGGCGTSRFVIGLELAT